MTSRRTVTLLALALAVACGSEAAISPPTVVVNADPHVLVGTWTIRGVGITMNRSTPAVCILDGSYPNTGCLNDTNSVDIASGYVTIASEFDSVACNDVVSGQPRSCSFARATPDISISRYINQAPKPRCSGQPISCWTLWGSGAVVTIVSAPATRSVGDTVYLSLLFNSRWQFGVFISPPAFSPRGELRFLPPYNHYYDSSADGIFEMSR